MDDREKNDEQNHSSWSPTVRTSTAVILLIIQFPNIHMYVHTTTFTIAFCLSISFKDTYDTHSSMSL